MPWLWKTSTGGLGSVIISILPKRLGISGELSARDGDEEMV